MLRRALAVPAVAAVMVCGCSSAHWPAFRHDALRTAAQLEASPLSDPEKVKKLKCMWRFPKHGAPDLPEGFRASPVVYKGRVFIGNGNGYFYALNARTGRQLWQYPPATCPPDKCRPLTSKFTCNVSSLGIASSATIAKIRGMDSVIFAAPDPCVGTGLGEGRLFALNTRTGKEIWKSPVIARLTGCTDLCPLELHENLGHSSPLVLGDKVYVGVSDHCDNPVQQGRVVAVHLATGCVVGTFSYCSTGTCGDGTRGGGVWSPPAGLKDSIYITTSNTRIACEVGPKPNRGLSLLRLNAATGTVAWQFQPLLFEVDNDSDWSAAPTVMSTSCGLVIVSTQKDGWTHAVNADGSWRWSFPPPPKGLPFKCCDGTSHGDSRYMRSGAVWGDVYVAMTGGLDRLFSERAGYQRLHAFNVCEPDPKKLLRWMVEVPGTSKCSDEMGGGPEKCLGNPTVTRGIFYIGTDKGHLVAIADPTVVSKDELSWRCANAQVPSAICAKMGSYLVPEPEILKDVKLTGSMVYTEPALANGKVYVSTADEGDGKNRGYVYMLRPSKRKKDRCDPPPPS
jgi:outer membrane protein assembly factor BamB